MKAITTGRAAAVFDQFNKLDYAGRIQFFDRYFDLVPYSFPAFDPSLSWYRNSAKFNELLKIFTEEKLAGRSLYEKQVEEEGQIFLFSILPHRQKQRILLNQYLLNTFAAEKASIQQEILDLISQRTPLLQLIKSRITLLEETFEWISHSLKHHQQMLRTQFLQIVNNGMMAYPGFDQPINSKRKFIEIYLFSQGYLMMDHYNWLIELYDTKLKEENTELLSLSQKIILLHELGVIDYLKSKIREKDSEKINHEISRIISMVTAEKEIYYSSVLEFINSLGSGESGKEIAVRHRQLINVQLEKFK